MILSVRVGLLREGYGFKDINKDILNDIYHNLVLLKKQNIPTKIMI